jgi:hypothetical protein
MMKPMHEDDNWKMCVAQEMMSGQQAPPQGEYDTY